jgi:hypothetical protein
MADFVAVLIRGHVGGLFVIISVRPAEKRDLRIILRIRVFYLSVIYYIGDIFLLIPIETIS